MAEMLAKAFWHQKDGGRQYNVLLMSVKDIAWFETLLVRLGAVVHEFGSGGDEAEFDDGTPFYRISFSDPQKEETFGRLSGIVVVKSEPLVSGVPSA